MFYWPVRNSRTTIATVMARLKPTIHFSGEKLPADGSQLGLAVANAVLKPGDLFGGSLCALFVGARLLQRTVEITHHHSHGAPVTLRK